MRKKSVYQQHLPVAENVNSQNYAGQIGSIGTTIHIMLRYFEFAFVSSIKNAVTLSRGQIGGWVSR